MSTDDGEKVDPLEAAILTTATIKDRGLQTSSSTKDYDFNQITNCSLGHRLGHLHCCKGGNQVDSLPSGFEGLCKGCRAKPASLSTWAGKIAPTSC